METYRGNLKRSGVPRRFAEHTLASMKAMKDDPDKTEAYAAACSMSKNSLVQYGQGRAGLMICGEFGTGKTALATATLKEMIWDKTPPPSKCNDEGFAFGKNPGVQKPFAIWTTFYNFIREIQDCYRPGADTTTRQVIKKYQTIDMLLLDDVSDLESESESADRRRLIYEVLDYRNNWILPTIITTNLMPNGLEKRFGERVFQRMFEHFYLAKLAGRNYRVPQSPKAA